MKLRVKQIGGFYYPQYSSRIFGIWRHFYIDMIGVVYFASKESAINFCKSKIIVGNKTKKDRVVWEST
jgi:hypothetical protein